MENRLTGAYGEQAAAQYLRKNGYTLVAANYRTFVGEIDIIAEKNEYICFVEVKTRKMGGLCAPAEAVDGRKISNLRGSAAAFLERFPTDKKVRFDIIEVLTDGEKAAEINHIKNAF